VNDAVRLPAIVFLLVLLLPVPTAAQHPQEHARLHDEFYSRWMRPDHRWPTGERYQSCCNNIDCAPARFRQTPAGLEAQDRNGVWRQVPASVLEQNQDDEQESPDGQSHACILSSGQVICATLGNGM